jgi:hypothetical protein
MCACVREIVCVNECDIKRVSERKRENVYMCEGKCVCMSVIYRE